MVKMVDVDGDNELDCMEFKKLIGLIAKQEVARIVLAEK